MNCVNCNKNKIGPKTEPYGGFLCGNEHMQCIYCNTNNHGNCGICRDNTIFVQMTLNPIPESLASAQTRIARSAVGQTPTAPLLSNSSIITMEKPSSFLPKALLDEIETQSNISQEHLSMNESKESETMKQEDQQDVISDQSTNAERDTTIGVSTENDKNGLDHTASVGLERLRNLNQIPERNMESLRMPVQEQNLNTCYGFAHSHDRGSNAVNNKDHVRLSVSNQQQNNDSSQLASGGASNNNIFIFQEDSEDHNIIHTSELRFVDSTESLNNILAGETSQLKTETHQNHVAFHPPPPKYSYVVTTESGGQLSSLSPNALRDFDEHNTAQRQEVVERYLMTYGPLDYYHFPSYNCQYPQCDYSSHQQQHQNHSEMKSKSVSTDSDPRLKTLQPPTISVNVKRNATSKSNSRDYIVMHSTGVSRLQMDNMQCMDKFGRPSLDMRMQKILETLQEDPKTRNLVEKPTASKGNVMKLVIQEKEANIASPRHPQHQHLHANSRRTGEENSDAAILRFLNSYHAFYQPRDFGEPPVGNLHSQTHYQSTGREPPPPQYEMLQCSPAVFQELRSANAHFSNSKALTACMWNIPRLPIKCPESSCQRMIFVSNFNTHLVVDHSHLPMERITPFQCKNFFIDPRLAHCGSSKCRALYLLRDKIIDLGSSKYKDFLPLLVMTSRVSLHQMCGVRGKLGTDDVEFLIIWITGIVPEEVPIFVSLTVWPRSGQVPSCHLVYSGIMDSIRKSQQGLEVWRTGHMLMLSRQEVDLLTNGGKDMLSMQLVVH